MMLKTLRYFLFPISLVYALVVRLRAILFDKDIFKSYSFDIPTICIGNVMVGGTGKTPMIEYMVRILSPSLSVATLSRGYGRETRGFLEATNTNGARELGDEPAQIKRKYPKLLVAVCENRKLGIESIQNKADVVLLDDAFQHRKVRAGFNVLLFDYQRLMKKQWYLPTGDLREGMWAMQRARVVVVTKCSKSISLEQKQQAIKLIGQHTSASVYFTSVTYGAMYHWQNQDEVLTTLQNYQVLLLTGIAQAQHLLDKVRRECVDVVHFEFADHHSFTEAELFHVLEQYNTMPEPKLILTTEKDAERLRTLSGDVLNKMEQLPIYVAQIQVDFLEKEEEFNHIILDYVEQHKRNGRSH